MTSTTDPQLVTAAEAARLLGVLRQRVLEQAASAVDFPAAELTPTGGRTWPRAAVQAWAAAHPDLGPVFTGPDVPADHGRTRQVWAVLNLASSEAQALNHPWIGPDHLGLAMLPPTAPVRPVRCLSRSGPASSGCAKRWSTAWATPTTPR